MELRDPPPGVIVASRDSARRWGVESSGLALVRDADADADEGLGLDVECRDLQAKNKHRWMIGRWILVPGRVGKNNEEEEEEEEEEVEREEETEMIRFGSRVWVNADDGGEMVMNERISVAASVVLRVIDDQGDSYELPKNTSSSVRQQVAEAISNNVVLCPGAIIENPANIAFHAKVVRCIPRDEFVCCTSQTSVTFEHIVEHTDENKGTNLDKKVSDNAIETKSSNSEQGQEPFKLLEELIIWPIQFQETFSKFGNLTSPKGILLYGPPGTGKTTTTQRIAEKLSELTNCLFLSFGTKSKDSSIGEREEHLRSMFAKAREYVKNKGKSSRAIVFIDELDGLCPKRTGTSISESRTVAQLLTLMDGHDATNHDDKIIIIGATNRPNAIDQALRRPGRFEKEIFFRPPDHSQRATILKNCIKKAYGKACYDGSSRFCQISESALFHFARTCVGFVGADLEALVGIAIESAKNSNESSNVLTLADLENAKSNLGKASLLRRDGILLSNRVQSENDGGVANVVGGYEGVKKELEKALEWPYKHKDALKRMNLSPPRGILMHGPPGCSKTTLARFAATRSGFSFFKLSGADVYSPFVGEAESTIRQIFATARLALPAIIFLDEIDALVGKRGLTGAGSGSSSSTGVQSRVLSTLLNEMDGVQINGNLLVLGATNRIDMIDEALLRPGRFDKLVHVPLPALDDRKEILKIHARKIPIENREHLIEQVAELADGKSGAELENLCREAAMNALRDGSNTVNVSHFSCFPKEKQKT